MTGRQGPFIAPRNRIDLLTDLARVHSDEVVRNIGDLIATNLIDVNPKKDGKDGSKDAGEAGFWDKKDGKEGKDKEKDGKESKEGKEGKESKDGKESKEGKESKDGKEGKESKEGGKEGKESKEGSKDGKDKDKDGDGEKWAGSEFETWRYGDELVLPADLFDAVAEHHAVRLAALLNQPII